MTEVRTVARQIQQLEIYLNNLVSALTRGELPVNLQPITQIFDYTISNIAPNLNLSEDRFIELYNDIPQILTAYAIDVTLSGDSYRRINDNITFNRFHRGNYWIIPTQELIDKAWLVPNPLKNLSFDRMPSLYASFDRDIINENRGRNFHTYFLVAPALVQLLPVEPLTWKLLERGKITNSQIQKPTVTIAAIETLYEQLSKNKYRQDRLAYDLDELLKELSKTKDIIAAQAREIDLFKAHTKSLSKIEADNNCRVSLYANQLEQHRTDIDDLQEITTKLIARIEKNNVNLEFEHKNISQDIVILESKKIKNTNVTREKPRLLRKQLSQIPIPLSSAQQEIISEYYHNISQFAVKYHPKIASLSKESVNYNRGNEDKNVILEETNRGSYWIFNCNDVIYLVPVEGKYINQHSYTTTTSIFESHNYTPDYKKIQLVKPAIVSIEPNTNPQTWRLQQQGELVFL